MTTKKISLVLKSGEKTEKLQFEKTELIVGSSDLADIKISSPLIHDVHCRLVLEGKKLRVVPLERTTREINLAVGESISLDDEDQFNIKFDSIDLTPNLKLVQEDSFSAEESLKSMDVMMSSQSDLPDVEAEAEYYLNKVKAAGDRISRMSAKADAQFQTKVSQSSARAHRILEQTSRDIEELTKEAQKKVFYLNHEITEKSDQLAKTINFLEGQAAEKQEDLEEIIREIENLEFKKVALKKDIKVKESEFNSIQTEYTSLINDKKNELLHLSEETNSKRSELEDVSNKLILEDKRFEDRSFVLKKEISSIEQEQKEKENLLMVLKENYRNLEEDIDALQHEKKKAALKVKEEENIIDVLIKKKELVQNETQRIIEQSKSEALNISKSSALKAEESKKEAFELREKTRKEAENLLAEAKLKYENLTKDSQESSQKLVEIAKAEAKQILTEAEAKLEQAKLEYENKLKAAQAESSRIITEAQENKENLLSEIEKRRDSQMKFFDEELEKFKEGLNEKASKLAQAQKLSDLREEPKKSSVLNKFSSLIDSLNKNPESKADTHPAQQILDEKLKEEETKLAQIKKDEELAQAQREAEKATLAAKKAEDQRKVEEEAAIAAKKIEEERKAQEAALVKKAAEEKALKEEQEKKAALAAKEKAEAEAKAKFEAKKAEELAKAEAAAKAKADEIEKQVAEEAEARAKAAAAAKTKEESAFDSLDQVSVKETEMSGEPEVVVQEQKPVKEGPSALVVFVNQIKALLSSKAFMIAAPTGIALMLCVVYAPKILSNMKEKRDLAKIEAEANKEKEVAKEEKAEESRDLASVAKAPAKAANVFHTSYTDRVLYTEDYIKNEFTSAYRSKWIAKMRGLIVEDLKFSETELAPIITTETALLRALDQMNKRSKNVDLMAKLEEQLLKKLKTQLKKDENFDTFFELKESFYKSEYPVK